MANNVIPINARRINAEARREILHEASEAAQKRLGEFESETDDHVTLFVIELLQMECWRIENWAAGTRYEEECLFNLRYIRWRFPITERNLRTLLICMYVVDDRYRDAV
jgi:hypothetical protein